MNRLQWNHYQSYILQLCLWLVIVLVGWFGIRFFMQEIQKTQNQLQEYVVLGEYRQKQMAEIPHLEGQYAFINEHQETLSLILTKEEIVDFIKALEQIAETLDISITMTSNDNTLLESKTTSKVKIGATGKDDSSGSKESSDEPTPAVKKAPVKKVTGIREDLPLKQSLELVISVSGEYPSIIEFLHRVETMPYALDIISLHLEEHPQEKDIFFRESGVNLFSSDETTAPAIPVLSDRPFLLDAYFETVIYIKE